LDRMVVCIVRGDPKTPWADTTTVAW